jgi:hypothetical protein
MVNLHKHQPSNEGEAVQILQDQLDHQALAANQNQIMPDQSHQNPLRNQARQQAQDLEEQHQSRLCQLKEDTLDEGGLDQEGLDEAELDKDGLDEGDLRHVKLDESKLDPQERQVSNTQRYAPGPDHASPEQQKQDQLNLEKHTANEQVEEANKREQADKNPQVPGNQQHQSPGSALLNDVKQQQGIDTLIDNT